MIERVFSAAVKLDANTWGLPKIGANDNTMGAILGMVYTLIGAVSLFYIIRGALLFVTGGDNPNDIKQAKMTILIAASAFVMASAVFGIVNFVIANVGGRN